MGISKTSTEKLEQERKDIRRAIIKYLIVAVGPISLFVIWSLSVSDSVFRLYPRIFLATALFAVSALALYDVGRNGGESSLLLRLLTLNAELNKRSSDQKKKEV